MIKVHKLQRNLVKALLKPIPREVKNFAPQPGPQMDFLATPADICIYGGAAGGGKSFGLLLDPLRHFNNPDFGAVIFRRNTTQVRNEGGLWDESMGIYPFFEGTPRKDVLEWNFKTGMRIKFAHLEHEKSVFDWQGSAIPLVGFDELTHFTQHQFFYMMSRNRSTCGVRPYIRATTNPDPDSWVRKFIDWWIGADGFAIKERSGVIRWFIRQDDKIIWGASREELINQYGKEFRPKSVTFIPAKLTDNQILMKKDPGYLANLLAMNRVDRGRLLDGNWNIRASAGMMFQRQWFPVIDAIPPGWARIIRFWDRAATTPSEANPDPDYTRGLKLYQYPNGSFVIADVRTTRTTPGRVEELIKQTAAHDGIDCQVMSQQDPGSAGVCEAEHFVKSLGGFDVHTMLTSKDKVTRAKPVSAQAEAGNVSVLRAPWNNEFFVELENFPEGSHDDQVDVLSGAYNALIDGPSLTDFC